MSNAKTARLKSLKRVSLLYKETLVSSILSTTHNSAEENIQTVPLFQTTS